MARRLLYVGCLGYGNAGDEACLEAARRLLEPVLPAGWELDAIDGYGFSADQPFDAVVLGGGTLLSPHGNLGDDALREARRRGAPYYVFGTGLEGPDWDGPVDPDRTARFAELVGGAELIGVRGPASRDHLAGYGVAADRIEVVGDLALALEPDGGFRFDPPDAGPWVAGNVGTSFGHVFGRDEEAAADTLAEALDAIAARGRGVWLFPVWGPDLGLQRRVAGALSHRPRVHSEERVLDAPRAIAALGRLDAAIAMKLHAGIFAAIAGIPYVPWSYRPKVEGFARSIGVEAYAVRTDEPAAALLAAFERLERDRDAVVRGMARAVHDLRGRLRDFASRLASRLPSSAGVAR